MKDEKISNFHTHTYLCGHASGTVTDYVIQASKDGCSALGMSEHGPYPKDSGINWASTFMDENSLKEYSDEIEKCRKIADFPLYKGFECEYAPCFKNWYEDKLLGESHADFLVYGPHWVFTGSEYLYIMRINKDNKELFHKYVNQTVLGIESGLYDFVAHPDLFMGAYKDWDSDSEAMLKTILDAAKQNNLPVEINGNGMLRGLIKTNVGTRYNYPYDEFWEIVRDSKVEVICNSDAHNPKLVIEGARKAREFAKKHGIVPIDGKSIIKKK